MSSGRSFGREGRPDGASGEVSPIAVDDRSALLLLRMLGVADATLNQSLPARSPTEIARELCAEPIPEKIERRIASALRELERAQAGVITVADADYPPCLHQLEGEKPPMLFYRGDLELLRTPMVAIVGTRRSTEYGNEVAETLAADLARHGITVISGLALGIDAHAHLGALQAGGKTVAVLGCGIDVLYPQRNAFLQERIAAEGLLLSEFAPGEPALKHHFLQRNRLIAKLAGGVVVVEAGLRSGSHNTAGWAGTYGVQVFAVPGPIGRPASMGTNALIQDGAKLVMSVRDIIEELPWRIAATATSPETSTVNPVIGGAAGRVFEVLGPVAVQIDQVARAAKCDTSEALALLAELELDGYVQQLPGKRFVRARMPEPPLGRRVLS
jgi:DNA processing protein